MGINQIHHMHIVTNAGAIRRGVVGAMDHQRLAFARNHIQYDRHKMGFGLMLAMNLGVLPDVDSASPLTDLKGRGLWLAAGAGYEDNTLHMNNGGLTEPQIQGGVPLGTNVCNQSPICP